MNRKTMAAAAVFLCFLLTAATGRAGILTVCSSGCGYTTIQGGINAAVAGDIVLVEDGVYNGRINFNGKAITVQSRNGAASTTIHGDQLGSVVTMNMTGTPRAMLKGFTVNNGLADNGGGVYCVRGKVVDCVISGNQAIGDEPKGGGVYCDHGIVSSSSITENTVTSTNTSDYYANASGGGVYSFFGRIDRCAILNNSLLAYYTYGGGIDANNGLVENCIINANTAYGHWYADGGGVYMTGNVDGLIRNCLISANDAHTDKGTYTVNTASGGGISFFGGGDLDNCTISSNSVDGDYTYGGGVNFGGTFRNTIIYGNHALAQDGAEGDNYYLNQYGPATFDRCCSLPLPTGSGNIADDPTFASGVYKLDTGSPCINTGINEAWMNTAADLDGNWRIAQDTVDMGAYEFASGTYPPPPIFFDDFTDGGLAGDPEWKKVQGTWKVKTPAWYGGKLYTSSALTNAVTLVNGLFLTSGRIESKFKIEGTSPPRSILFLFDYRSPTKYRYVQIKQLLNGVWKMYLGQKGSYDGGGTAIRGTSKPLAGIIRKSMHDIRIDIYPDGDTHVWLDGAQKIDASFAGPHGGGQVGLRSDKTVLDADKFTVHDEAVLAP